MWKVVLRPRAAKPPSTYNGQLFAVRHPDILDLGRGAQELLPFALLGIQPRARAAIVDPRALHIPRRGQFYALRPIGAPEVPHGINIVVLGQHLAQNVALAGDDVDDAGRQVQGLEDLVAVGSTQRRDLRGDDDEGVSHSDCRGDQRDEAKQGIFVGTGDADDADRFRQGQHNAAQWGTVHAPLVLVAPGSVAEQARERHLHLVHSIGVAAARLLHDPARKLISGHGEILGHVVENLRAIMRCTARPAAGLVRSLDGVTDIFAVPLANLADYATNGIKDAATVSRIGTRLLARDEELGCTVDRW